MSEKTTWMDTEMQLYNVRVINLPAWKFHGWYQAQMDPDWVRFHFACDKLTAWWLFEWWSVKPPIRFDRTFHRNHCPKINSSTHFNSYWQFGNPIELRLCHKAENRSFHSVLFFHNLNGSLIPSTHRMRSVDNSGYSSMLDSNSFLTWICSPISQKK